MRLLWISSGIIPVRTESSSTKPALIKRARELSLYTTLRVFVLDSMAFDIEKQMSVVASPTS